MRRRRVDPQTTQYELRNPAWVGAFAVIGGILVSVAIVCLFAVMW